MRIKTDKVLFGLARESDISDVAGTALSGSEIIPMIQSASEVYTTPTALKAFMSANSANIYGYVTAYADLPLGVTTSDPEINDLVGVNTTTGVWILGTQRRMGFYKRVALTGVAATDYGTTPFAGFPTVLMEDLEAKTTPDDTDKLLLEEVATGNTQKKIIWANFKTAIASFGANVISTTLGLKTPKIYPAADSTTAFQINKADGSTNVMNIDTTNGRVGIGTTSPGAVKLDVAGNMRVNNTIYSSGNLDLRPSTNIVSIYNAQYDYTLKVYSGTSDNVVLRGNGVSYFNSGNVGIGTTDLDGTPAVGKLTIKGSTNDGTTNIFVGRDSDEANVIEIDTDGDVLNTNNSYGALSDVKLKENIKDATPKLADILKVSVKNFNMKGDTLKQLGVVAQDLEAIFPGMVKNIPDTERIPDPKWEPKMLQHQKTETIKKQVEKTEIVEVDGKWVKKVITEEVEETISLFNEFDVYDEQGSLLPEKHKVPIMESYLQDESERPTIVVPTGTYTKAIKYSVFIPMLIKAIQELNEKIK